MKKISIKKTLKRMAVIVSAFFLAIVALSFPYGPLLAWSPIKPGYNHLALERADIYFSTGEQLLPDYQGIDRMMNEAEAFHHLKFQARMEIIACKDWGSCARYLPWLTVRVLGGVTLATGDVIYITPRLKERNLSTAEFLRHELSHALISQNTTIRNSVKLTNQAWFSEGLAVSFGRQAAYLSGAEFLAKAKDAEMIVYLDPERIDQSIPGWSIRFAYPAQRYFLEYLKVRFGDDRFQQFLLGYLATPDEYRKIFADVFGLSFADAIGEYQQAIRDGIWTPEP
jgi:hypothetical protein